MKVVITALDSCPLGALGPYGNEWIATPNLDRFASEGVVFDAHYASQVRSESTIDPRFTESLKARGVRTALLRHTRTPLSPDFYAAWDERFDVPANSDDPTAFDSLLRTLPEVIASLEKYPDWLLWIDIDRLTPPWNAPQHVFDVYVEELEEATEEERIAKRKAIVAAELADEEYEEPIASSEEKIAPWTNPPVGWFDRDDLASWELLHRSFAAAMTLFDADFALLREVFVTQGLDREIYEIVTAAKGFPLGEHGMVGPHRWRLYEELVHLPLLLRRPGGAQPGQRIETYSQPNDLLMTLAQLYGSDLSLEGGFSLAGQLEGSLKGVRDEVITRGPDGGAALRTHSGTLILPGDEPLEDGEEPSAAELYVRPDDRHEFNDLAGRLQETRDTLLERLQKML